MWNLFKMSSKKSVGVDIGTSSIKIIELSEVGRRIRLENYGEARSQSFLRKLSDNENVDTLLLSVNEVTRVIISILKKANILTKKAVFSIPDFASFFTTFYLPPMSSKELKQAVLYEAEEHIPVPLSKVTLDWEIIEGRTVESKIQKGVPIKILLVAAPNEVINQYSDIAAQSGLELNALEVEEMALSAALIKGENKNKVVCILDIGARSTTVNIVDKGVLKSSYSLDISGTKFTNEIAKSLHISYNEAESLKQKIGLSNQYQVKNAMFPLLATTLGDIEKIFKNFEQSSHKKIEKVIVAGGSALLPDLIQKVSDYFQLKYGVEIANPFSDIFYPPILKKTILKVGPRYTIAVGNALRGLEE